MNNRRQIQARSEVVWWTAACHQRKGVQVYPMTGASWNDHHGAIGAGNRQKWATYRKNKRLATVWRADWELKMVVVVGVGVVCWAEARGEVAQKEGRNKKTGPSERRSLESSRKLSRAHPASLRAGRRGRTVTALAGLFQAGQG